MELPAKRSIIKRFAAGTMYWAWTTNPKRRGKQKKEFPVLFNALCQKYDSVIIIANSIGAFFAMNALREEKIEKPLFIFPVVNMEKLIANMMMWANVTENQLRSKKRNSNTIWGDIVLGIFVLCAGKPY